MAKLTRVTGKVFGGSAPLNEIGQFGSALAGNPTNTQDVATIQALDAYSEGWGSAVISSRQFPPIEEVTGALKTISYQGCYLLQEGIPEYDIDTEYSNTSIVKSINNGTTTLYVSLANGNKGNSLSNSTYWKPYVLDHIQRNIGEVVTSTVPLTDAGLHPLDGALLAYGSYAEFVDYITKFATIIPTNIAADNLQGFTVSATASATEAYYMFNNYTYPRWQFHTNAYEDPQSFTVIFPTSKDLSSYTVENYADGNLVGRIVTAWTLEYTKDGGTTWTQCDTRSGISQTQGLVTTCYLSSTIENINGIRFTATAGGTGGYSSVGQVRFYQTKATDLFIEESEWQSAVATYGVCDKYVYNSTNNTVRLPKYGNQIVTSIPNTTPVVGNGKTLGFTDGTTNFGVAPLSGGSPLGVFRSSNNTFGTSVGTSAASQGDVNGKTIGITADATNSGLVANLSNLSAQALDVYYYIVIATSTKTDIQVDIDEIVTDLNGKADVDLSNVTPSQSFINSSINWGMPDYSAGVSVSSSPYTAPSDGVIIWWQPGETNNEVSLFVNGNLIYRKGIGSYSGRGFAVYLPISKDDIFTYSGWETDAQIVTFYPFKGV